MVYWPQILLLLAKTKICQYRQWLPMSINCGQDVGTLQCVSSSAVS